MTRALILTGDHHTGHLSGLMSPKIKISDDGARRAARWLWAYWLECWQEAKEFTAGCKQRTWVMNGDLVDFDLKGRSNQYFTNDKSEVIYEAINVLEPGLDVTTDGYIIIGTGAHTGKDGEYEKILANDLDSIPPAIQQLRGNFNGIRLDVAHHTSGSRIPWNCKNVANKIATVTMMDYARVEELPPHLVIRSHIHLHADSHDNFPTRAVVLPAWQLFTSYGMRLDPNSFSDIGMIIFLIDKGKIVAEKKIITDISKSIGKKIWTVRI